MGSECRHVYRHNLNLSVAGQGDPAVIRASVWSVLDELEKYFKPAKNTIYERYVFGSCKQEEGESIDNFVTRLRERAATCEYGQLKDEMIRDKIVLGVANESIRRRLLREKGLTLITAIEMCRAAEQTGIRMRAMEIATSPPHIEAVHAVAKQHSRQNQWKQSNPPRTGDTGSTCERLGFMQFTIPEDVLKVEHAQPGALTKEQLINKYSDVFNSPVESVPGEVHFDLDPNVPAVQSAPRNVPIVMKAAVKAQLDNANWTMRAVWRKRWLKLPFGVSVAPEVYQRKQHELLAGLKGIEPIADDILVVGCGDTDKEAESDHDAKLVALMERCREVKLRLGLKKLQFKVAEVQFHGHILSSAGLKPDPEKVRAIIDMPNLTDAKGVQRLIGFANYLAKFMPHLSSVCEPLRRLLDKDTPWHWLPKHEAAVYELKSLATTMPVLRYYDVTKPITIQSDASQSGLGCCLMQEGQPIAFASRALTPTEKNYAQIEKECLSIVFACQRFHHYLYGRDPITAETDHKPLISIFSKPLLNAPKRLQSMLMTLQSYDLRVIYKPGPEMFISDTLSRATAGCAGRGTVYQRHAICSLQQEQEDVQHVNQADYLNVSSQRLEQIRRHTDRDECLQALKNTVLVGWPDVKEEAPLIAREYWPFRDEISVQNGVLFRGQKVIIPKSLRPEMLTRIHSSHIGGEACYRHAQETLYWPNMQTEIKDFVSTCSTCNVYAHNQQKETMLSHDLPTRPWQILSMDMFTHRQKDYLLIVDHYSDFWEIELLPDMSAETVIKRCKAQFARHGQSERVIM
ncbi:hypothetical protein SKAU_G00181520 [Synaphobranchus kaupii]|uniref:Gypsy retrotransposon integrase-like protein 1 n=1 Tax=Synaphobranchus kaupii TaxID=118154 RepID=A0A9Q1FM96_SYNKA|nr:hypothetical protein SKAU_G00181520 [Synaphobranchus kaupii]